jgi:hypothetical protein
MVKYPNITDVDFQKKIKQLFNEFKLKKDKKTIKDFCYPKHFTFQLPQLFVAEFLNPKTPYKGILLYHRIGAGKTCAAIQIAETWKQYKKIIIVTPASLVGNFYKELRSECTGNKYITKNERLQLNQLKPGSKEADTIINKTKNRIHEYYNLYSYHKYVDLYRDKKINLRNTLLIIDEVHNIVSEDGTFYEVIKKSIDNAPSDLRIVIMSATPIFDKPAELGMTINLLRPKHELPNQVEFNEMFLSKNNTLINEDKLVKYLQGYISYYQGAPAFSFPKTRIKYVKCRMSKFQSDAYKSFIDQEKKGLFTQSDILKLPDSFLLGGRMISNIAYPNKKIGDKGLDSLTNKYSSFDNLKRYSIKFYKILKKLERCPGPVFFYSNFKEHGGLEDFKRIIEFHGYTNVLDNGPGKKTYAVWSGDENSKEKDLIRDIYNSKDNEDGSKIKIILGSPAIKEGVSLLRVRQVHILEPYWNMSRVEQVIGRAVRFCSHKDLLKINRNVDIYIYLAIDDSNKISIDQHVLSIAIQKKLLIEQFETVLKKTAIDYYLFQN